MLWAIFGIIAVIEIYYWFVYFPRAWRDGSNDEINNIRSAWRYFSGQEPF